MDLQKPEVRPTLVSRVSEEKPVVVPTALVEEFTTNTSQKVVEVTEDKLRIVLTAPIEIAKKETERPWARPLGTLMSVTTILASTTFQDTNALGMKIRGETLHGAFLTIAFGAVVWLLHSIFARREIYSVEGIIAEVKGKQRVSTQNESPWDQIRQAFRRFKNKQG